MFINDISGNKTIQITLIGKVAKTTEIKLSANEIIDIANESFRFVFVYMDINIKKEIKEKNNRNVDFILESGRRKKEMHTANRV